MKNKIKKAWHKVWEWISPYLTPKMLPIVLTVYFCTNIVWYIIAFAPIPFIPSWLSIFAKGYVAFLYMPFTVEKPIIIAISVFVYRLIYGEKFEKKEEKV